MTTEVKFGDAARERLLRGVDTLADAIKATLGRSESGASCPPEAIPF